MHKLTFSDDAAAKHLDCYFQAIHDVLEHLANGGELFHHVPGIKGAQPFTLAKTNGCVRGLFILLFQHCSTRNDNFLVALPDRLWNLIDKIDHYVSVHGWGVTRSPYHECVVLLNHIFSYDRFKGGMGLVFNKKRRTVKGKDSKKLTSGRFKGVRWSAMDYIQSLNVRYCPYCNAETVYAIEFKKERPQVKSVRSALDHYFPQSRYPFLSISLGNLVPSCTRCNTDIKRDRELDYNRHLNPFMADFHDAVRFICKPIKVDVGFQVEDIKSEDGFLLSLVERTSGVLAQKGLALGRFFLVSDVYNLLFKYEALLDIYRSRLAGSKYYAYVREMLKENLSDEQIRELFCGVLENPADINKVRLSKLALDMHEMVVRCANGENPWGR